MSIDTNSVNECQHVSRTDGIETRYTELSNILIVATEQVVLV